jgi:hypothetical protein
MNNKLRENAQRQYYLKLCEAVKNKERLKRRLKSGKWSKGIQFKSLFCFTALTTIADAYAYIIDK